MWQIAEFAQYNCWLPLQKLDYAHVQNDDRP